MRRSRLQFCLRTFAVAAAVLVGAPLVSPTAPSAADAGNAAPAVAPAAATAAESAPDCGRTIRKRTGRDWQCTFSDDFTGTEIDRSKWYVQTTAFSGYTTAGAECYMDSSENVFVRDGALNLVARKAAEPFTCSAAGNEFTSGHTSGTVLTWERFSQAYGRFEFRARFPSTTEPGLHSALWLYPQTQPYGAWPHSGEIDVAEFYTGAPEKVYPSLHYAGRTIYDTGWNCPVTTPSRYHTYAVAWAPRRMSFYYDGKLCFRRSWTPDEPLTAPQPFDIPYYLVLTQAVGGEWNSPTADTPFPGRTRVDWVRVWK